MCSWVKDSIQFVFTSFTPFFTVLGEQRVYLGWAVARLTAVSAGVLAGAAIGQVRGAATGYSLAIAASFLFQHLLLMWLLKKHRECQVSDQT